MFGQIAMFKKRKREEEPGASTLKILNDPFLTNVYVSILKVQLKICELTDGQIVEIGSAGGITKFFKDSIITSDVRPSSGVDMVIDASKPWPFESESLDAVFAKDVLHHIPDVISHFAELERVLKPGGRAVYAEPNWNVVSRLVFRFLHPEPWLNSKAWQFESNDPMFANQALPWIVFVRDREKFADLFPGFEVDLNEPPLNGFAFLMSGGVFKRTKVSSEFLTWVNSWELRSARWMKFIGLTRIISIRKS
jgi:SAM-dependent methyltransferase